MDFKVSNTNVNIKVNTYGNSSNNNFKFNADTNFTKMNHKMYSYDDIAEIDFSKNIVYNNVDLFSQTGASVSNSFVSSIGASISNSVKSAWADATSWWSDVNDWWNKDAVPWIKNASKVIGGVLESTGATIVTFTQSLVEGVGQFVEAIVDFVAIIGTGVASIVTGLIDGGQAIYGAATGNEWESVTKKMWGGTMSFVSTQYVSGWFDLLYDNTGYGKWLKEKTFGFDITRSIGSGIGYIAGVVVLTIATAGAGSVAATGGTVSVSTATAATTGTQMAITAGVAGIGKGTQNAWADGADLGEGLVAGSLTGLWEGAQFYVGGKIGGTNLFGSGGGAGTKVLNSLGRVVLDGADGGVEGFVQPLISSTYKDGYYDENGNYVEFSNDQNIAERYQELFDDNGGWTSVWTQAAIGGASSAIGEAFDLGKYFKESKSSSGVDSNVSDGLSSSSSLDGEVVDADAMNLPDSDGSTGGGVSQMEGTMTGVDSNVSSGDATVELSPVKDADVDVKPETVVASETVSVNGKSVDVNSGTKKTFKSFSEFSAEYKEMNDAWEKSLTVKEKKIIKNYISENDYSSYVTINGVMRDTAIDVDNQTITLYHCWGKRTYTFDEYFAKYGETVEQFVTRTYEEAEILNNALSRTRFKEDTVIARGVDFNALERFGITKTDTPEEMLKKLGSVYTDKGFMSSTPVASGGFTGKEVNFVMTCKEGMPFGNFSTFNPGEQEVLLPYGSAFSVDNVEIVNGKIMIYMTSIN